MTEAKKTAHAAPAPPLVQNGTFTVSHSEKGHFTVKLYTAKSGALAGKRILALLVGPDNTSDFQGVAFWSEDPHPEARVWRRFRGTADIRIDGYHWTHQSGSVDGIGLSAVQQKLCIWADLAIRGSSEERRGYWYGEGYRLLHEGRCVVCNRPLTDPESIKLGIGPKCGGRS